MLQIWAIRFKIAQLLFPVIYLIKRAIIKRIWFWNCIRLNHHLFLEEAIGRELMVCWSVKVCGCKEYFVPKRYNLSMMKTCLNAISVESKAVGFDAKTSDIWAWEACICPLLPPSILNLHIQLKVGLHILYSRGCLVLIVLEGMWVMRFPPVSLGLIED